MSSSPARAAVRSAVLSAGAASAAGAVGVVAAAHLLPSVAAVGPLRRAVLPRLCGVGAGDHVALTFDDGPDARSTPLFVEALDRLDVRATFFLLGTQVQAAPEVAAGTAAAGHEVAVHGWSHRPHLLRTPRATAADLRRSRDLVAEVTGCTPRFWRPPHGIPTGAGLLAGARLGMRAVLWTADGRDWSAGATASGIASRIGAAVRPGGVVLLHDSDITSAPGSWRRALDALGPIVAGCRERGLRVGPLAEHFIV
ncbi:MAG: polysaccharide deacetylase family protein [Jatrophihabitans sp.]|nr:MAG: polysaccharide deacetylase family protein [Jatrophihabitans sp.]